MSNVSTERSHFTSLEGLAGRPEELRCPLCGQSDRISSLSKRGGNTVYYCKNCDVGFLFPQPTDAVLSAIYSDTYFLGEMTEVALQRREYLKRATAKLYLDTIMPFVRVQEPKLLEIGCGSGEFLIEAQSRGFQVEGLEYSEHAANTANNRLGRRAVKVGSPETESIPREAYNVIGAFDVIEHLHNPIRAVEYLCAALKPKGLLALVTPSLDSWSRHLLGARWMEYKTEHLTYFSRKSLSRLLDATGFEVIHFSSNCKVLNLDYISSHFDRFPVPILTSLVSFTRRALPVNLAYRPIKLMTSGVMTLAQKRS